MTTATVEAERLLKELEELWKGLACADSEAASGGALRACALTLIALAQVKEPQR